MPLSTRPMIFKTRIETIYPWIACYYVKGLQPGKLCHVHHTHDTWQNARNEICRAYKEGTVAR